MAQTRYYYRTEDGRGTWNLKTPLTEAEQIQYGAIPCTAGELEEIARQNELANQPTAEQIARQEKVNRINELKGLLAATDYQAIKFAEGWITAEDYAETKALRQSYRDEINELQSELGE